MFCKGIRQLYASRYSVRRNQAACVHHWRDAMRFLAVLKKTAANPGYPRVKTDALRVTLIRRYGDTKIEAL